MTLNKAIEHGKEKRKPYSGAKEVDKTCRNHGSCDWCKSNRLYQRHKVESAAEDQMKEVNEDVLAEIEHRSVGERTDEN